MSVTRTASPGLGPPRQRILAQSVYDAASVAATAAALVPHGITAAKLKALQDAIKKFTAVVPAQKITSRKSATERLAEEFAAAERCLTEGLDLLIGQFERSSRNS